MTHKCWMAVQGRRVYLALSSGGCGSTASTSSWGCSSASLTGHSLLRHHCRHNPMGAVVPQVGHIPQVELDEGRLRAPVGSLHNVLEAPGVGEHQGGSPCSDLMRPGHYPRQIRSRPRVGCRNHLRQPPRYTWMPDVLCIAFVPGDKEVAASRAKRAGPPPVNPQSPDRAKSTVFVIRAENGGKGLDMDDGGRVPWRLVLGQELGKEAERERSIWLWCNIGGQAAQGMHLTAPAAGGEGNEENRFQGKKFQWNFSNGLVWGKTKGREDQEKVPRWSTSGVPCIPDGRWAN